MKDMQRCYGRRPERSVATSTSTSTDQISSTGGDRVEDQEHRSRFPGPGSPKASNGTTRPPRQRRRRRHAIADVRFARGARGKPFHPESLKLIDVPPTLVGHRHRCRRCHHHAGFSRIRGPYRPHVRVVRRAELGEGAGVVVVVAQRQDGSRIETAHQPRRRSLRAAGMTLAGDVAGGDHLLDKGTGACHWNDRSTTSRTRRCSATRRSSPTVPPGRAERRSDNAWLGAREAARRSNRSRRP
jgi:hypothetical protein